MNNIISDFNEAAKLLKSGKIGIFPTDTAYGIGCRMDQEELVDKVYQLRNRPSDKALLALVSSIEMAKEYVQMNEVGLKLAIKYWPGGLTIIFTAKVQKVPLNVMGGGQTLALRMPNHPDILQMIEKVGAPIVAPSANFSGQQTPTTLGEVDMELAQMVDFVLSGVCTMKGVSTIVDATKNSLKIIREGVISKDEIIY